MSSSAAPGNRRAWGPSSFSSLVAYSLLALEFASVANAGNYPSVCNSLNCFDKSDNEGAKGPYSHIKCSNKDAPKKKEGWAIWKAQTFPTVEVIVADLKACGLIDKGTSMFYSYGGGLTAANNFKKKNPTLNLQNINDLMPQTWYDALGEKWPAMQNAAKLDQAVWVARSSQAMARASKGKVYLVTADDAHIYQTPNFDPDIPWKGRHNVWYDYEFSTLQNNKDVTGIYSVGKTKLEIDTTDKGAWERNPPKGKKAAEHIDANTVTVQSIQAQKDKWEKDQKDCNKNCKANEIHDPEDCKKCKACPAGQKSSPDKKTCVPDDKKDDKGCSTTCKANEIQDPKDCKKCQACPARQKANPEKKACIPDDKKPDDKKPDDKKDCNNGCKANEIQDPKDCKKCQACPARQKPNPEKKACIPDDKKPDDKKDCKTCKANEIQDPKDCKKCTACSSKQKPNKDKTACINKRAMAMRV